MSPQIVTANRLRDGEVVYMTPSGDWSEDLKDSVVAQSAEEADGLLDKAVTPNQELIVVGPYLAEVEQADGVVVALSQREIIRATGPTVHRHFGKQAREG